MDYRTTFGQRGSDYDSAMARAPQVRASEFRALVTFAQIQTGERVADVPSGGGYLGAYLPSGVELFEIDTADSFLEAARRAGKHPLQAASLKELPLESSSVDVVLSLAGLHHEPARDAFYREVARVLRPGGRLVVAEVWEGTKVARFLDGFVDQHGEGHQGSYLCESDLRGIRVAGFSKIEKLLVDVPWRCPTRRKLAEFARELFSVRRATVEDMEATLEREIGFRVASDSQDAEFGCVELSWELTLVSALIPHVPHGKR
jgi:SAM-dependent methyltransferase